MTLRMNDKVTIQVRFSIRTSDKWRGSFGPMRVWLITNSLHKAHLGPLVTHDCFAGMRNTIIHICNLWTELKIRREVHIHPSRRKPRH